MNVNLNVGKILTGFKTVADICKKHNKGIRITVKWVSFGTAVVYAVSKAPKTFHDIEEAGEKKGSELTTSEKVGIVVKNQYPAMIAGTVFVGTDIAHDIIAAKEMKNAAAEKASLIGQIADLTNSYNLVNEIKNSMAKKLEENGGKEAVEEAVNPVMDKKNNELVKSVHVTDRAYVADPRKLDYWNDIYMKTGDVDYKIQEYLLSSCGQIIVSCNHAWDDAEKEMNRLLSSETGRGSVSENELFEIIGARTTSTGEYRIWRSTYEYFGLKRRPIEEDGVALIEVTYFTEPYIDIKGQYSW